MRPLTPSILAFSLLAACAGGTTTTTGSATLEGAVTGAAAANLLVEVPGTPTATHTDAKGGFVLLDVPPGATQLHFKGAGTDATLSIAKVLEQEHRRVSVTVDGGSAREHHEQSESEFKGKVESISAPNLTVAGRTVVTSAATTITRKGAAIALADLQIGDLVEVEGALQHDGSVAARSIHVEDASAPEADDDVPVLVGTLTAIDGSKLTVSGVTVLVDAATVIRKADAKIDLAALKVGDRLVVEGKVQADKSVLATRIRVRLPEEAEVKLFGAIAALDPVAKSLTIGETTVFTDAATRFEEGGTFAGLKVGDVVEVEATRRADGTLLARSIEPVPPAPPPSSEVELRGTIESLRADGLTVSGQAFAVDAKTEVRSKGSAVPFSSLKVGQVVEVDAVKRDGGLPPLAKRISVESGR